jgi:predicted transcriptional regulator
MKTETLTHVPIIEIKRAVANIIAEEGGQAGAGKELGVSRSYISYVLSGKVSPSGKLLSRFGLRKLTVYVPVEKTQGK